jgi:hypothetical protein
MKEYIKKRSFSGNHDDLFPRQDADVLTEGEVRLEIDR